MSLGYEIQENAPRQANTGAVSRCDMEGVSYPCLCITHTEDIPEKHIPQDILEEITSAITNREEIKPEYKDITKPVEEEIKYPLYLFIKYQGEIKQTLLLGNVPTTYLNSLFNLAQKYELVYYYKNVNNDIIALKDEMLNALIPYSQKEMI